MILKLAKTIQYCCLTHASSSIIVVWR